ncbi:uncharacterized protein LTR77_002897 [Saxophila tyrrhenica]|uniref:Uncharacterized protein n=1 Tax=Saxophila tyrrhenica TaxID=1690608 RepID=A0AAV9PJE1_9PEZI|nr:hypothetical protein LTR77_002897 [Saxophila tyrrhenica]
MADLADVPDIMGTVRLLACQIQDAKVKLVAAREENVALHAVQISLLENERRNEQKINELKFRLTDDVQTQRREKWALAKLFKSGRGAKIDRLKKQAAGGFVHFKGGGKYDLKDDEEERKAGMGKSLRSMAATFPASRTQPQILREHHWRLTRVAGLENDVAGDEDEEIDFDAAPELEASPPEPTKAERHDSLPVDAAIPSQRDRLKRRRSDFADPRRGSHHDQTFMEFAKTKRPRYEYRPGRLPRKPVCVTCWKESGLCDRLSQCLRCQTKGELCVRKPCADEWCQSDRCPCLHRGQWDETDESWIVEKGRMPQKDKDFVRPIKGGYWRPGDDDQIRPAQGKDERSELRVTK